MNTGQLIFGTILIAIGISSFTNFDIFHYLIPLLLIYFGIRVLLGRSGGKSRGNRYASQLNQDDINEVAVFSGSEKRVESKAFTGGKAASIFSGMDLDLTHAKIKGKRADLELNAVFGALKVYVPKDWHIVTEGAGVLGGFTNRTTGGSESSPKLYVRGGAVFGGVEIVN